jgi:hypothetical protein
MKEMNPRGIGKIPKKNPPQDLRKLIGKITPVNIRAVSVCLGGWLTQTPLKKARSCPLSPRFKTIVKNCKKELLV